MNNSMEITFCYSSRAHPPTHSIDLGFKKERFGTQIDFEENFRQEYGQICHKTAIYNSLGLHRPTHPHLGRLSQKKSVFSSSGHCFPYLSSVEYSLLCSFMLKLQTQQKKLFTSCPFFLK